MPRSKRTSITSSILPSHNPLGSPPLAPLPQQADAELAAILADDQLLAVSPVGSKAASEAAAAILEARKQQDDAIIPIALYKGDRATLKRYYWHNRHYVKVVQGKLLLVLKPVKEPFCEQCNAKVAKADGGSFRDFWECALCGLSLCNAKFCLDVYRKLVNAQTQELYFICPGCVHDTGRSHRPLPSETLIASLKQVLAERK